MKPHLFLEDLENLILGRDALKESLKKRKQKLLIRKIQGEISLKELTYKKNVIASLEKQIEILGKYIDILKIKKGLKDLINKNI